MATISTYTHQCIVREGDMAGNTHRVEVKAWDFEFDNQCDNCGEPLVTADQLLAHTYKDMTE
jgi:hypothetical protein